MQLHSACVLPTQLLLLVTTQHDSSWLHAQQNADLQPKPSISLFRSSKCDLLAAFACSDRTPGSSNSDTSRVLRSHADARRMPPGSTYSRLHPCMQVCQSTHVEAAKEQANTVINANTLPFAGAGGAMLGAFIAALTSLADTSTRMYWNIKMHGCGCE
jgi:hypothetical protein